MAIFDTKCECGHSLSSHNVFSRAPRVPVSNRNCLYPDCQCEGFVVGSCETEEYEHVDHPDHYNQHPACIECIDVIECMPFNMGSAIKYLWRAGLKPGSSTEQDLEKAIWYMEREQRRLREPRELLLTSGAVEKIIDRIIDYFGPDFTDEQMSRDVIRDLIIPPDNTGTD